MSLAGTILAIKIPHVGPESTEQWRHERRMHQGSTALPNSWKQLRNRLSPDATPVRSSRSQLVSAQRSSRLVSSSQTAEERSTRPPNEGLGVRRSRLLGKNSGFQSGDRVLEFGE